MKGIVLAGGRGTRLHPLTLAVSKQLLPVHSKPMIYYPISMLLRARIREILVITTPEDLPSYQRLLGSGDSLGVRFEYAVQSEPRGLADAFVVGRSFVGDSPVCLILGDNLFAGPDLDRMMWAGSELSQGAMIFAVRVKNPRRFGVVELDSHDRPVRLVEKPKHPRSPYAVPGIYFYDASVLEHAAHLEPSPRGELEITDLNRRYLELGQLKVNIVGKDTVWLDAGTPDSLAKAAKFVRREERVHRRLVGCPAAVAYSNGYIGDHELIRHAADIGDHHHARLLLERVTERRVPRAPKPRASNPAEVA